MKWFGGQGFGEALLAHYRTVWPKATFHEQPIPVSEVGPRAGAPAAVRIYRSDDARPGAITYVTVGMSGTKARQRIEAYLLAPEPNPFNAIILRGLAALHASEPVDVGHITRIGAPWFEGSRCTRCLVSLPYLDGPALEQFAHKRVRRRVLWLLPITEAERRLRIDEGLEALEQRFEKSYFNYLNPWRPCTVDGWTLDRP